MKKVNVVLSAMMLTAAVAVFSHTGWAVEPQSMDEQAMVSEGIVVSVEPGRIVVKELSETGDNFQEVSYSFNENTQWNQYDNLAEVESNDSIELEYKEVSGERVATSITKTTSDSLQNMSGEKS